MLRNLCRRSAMLSVGLLALSSTLAPVCAQDFYQGKTLTIIVGIDAGSGYDVYARTFARHLPKHLPGNPTVIVQNMPGAGGSLAVQHLANVAAKDGTVIALVFPGAIAAPLTDPKAYRYDPATLEYLGTADSGTRLCYTSATSKVRTMKDALIQKAIIGATAKGSSSWDYAYFLNALAGTKFEIVTGYKGPGDMFIAMERGETDGMCGIDVSTVTTMRADWLGSPKANFLVQAGLEPHPGLLKLGIPSIWDYITGENRQVAELIVSQQVFGRPYIAPPGVPEPQLKLLRTAFMAAHADPELLADAKKAQLVINPKSGEEVGALIRKMYAASPEIIARMTKAIRP